MKVYKSEMFVSLPRWKYNVPSTLAKLVPADSFHPHTIHVFNENSSLSVNVSSPAGSHWLQPFPSWDANRIGNPFALQSVLGFEIDPCGRLWALDQGRIEGHVVNNGQALKLVVYDVETGRVVHRHQFTPQISAAQAFLNDIVIDLYHYAAYISDSGIPAEGNTHLGLDPSIIVHKVAANESFRVLNEHSSVQANASLSLYINGDQIVDGSGNPMMTGADGIALTSDAKTLFFCPLTSTHMYSASALDLLIGNTKSVSDLGNRGFASDGISCDDRGDLYATSLTGSSILKREDKWKTIASDTTAMVWPDTLAWKQEKGGASMLFMSNQLHLFLVNKLPFSLSGDGEQNPQKSKDVLFRVWRVFIPEVSSYMHGMIENGASCSWPSLHPESNPNSNKLFWIFSVILLVVALLIGFTHYYKWRQSRFLLERRSELLRHDGNVSEYEKL